MPTTNYQIMRARKLLGLTLGQLGEAAGVCRATVGRVENGARVQKLTLVSLRAALERAGAEFLDDETVVERRDSSTRSLRP